jgi:hypothetical protein
LHFSFFFPATEHLESDEIPLTDQINADSEFADAFRDDLHLDDYAHLNLSNADLLDVEKTVKHAKRIRMCDSFCPRKAYSDEAWVQRGHFFREAVLEFKCSFFV